MNPVEVGETSVTAHPELAAAAWQSASAFALPHEVRVDGVPIRYGVSGSGSRDLLLVHGYRAHHMWWYRLLPALEERWRVIRLDLTALPAASTFITLPEAHHHFVLDADEDCRRLLEDLHGDLAASVRPRRRTVP